MNRAQKISATKAAKAAEFKNQAIQIDDNWRVIRADELNWELRFKGQFAGYYGTIADAFKALPAKMLSAAAKNSIADVLQCQAAIIKSIEKALSGGQPPREAV
jgi:hypothetical protein